MNPFNLFKPSRWIARWHHNWVNPFATVYFNFHYLPLRQAARLPIWLYGQPKLLALKGQVEIAADHVWCGMVKLNATKHTPYPSIPFEYVNDGGTITFQGPMSMDNGARIHVFGGGHIIFGAGIRCTSVTLGCQEEISLGNGVWVGNGSIIYDTDFHLFRERITGETSCPFKCISIGDYTSIFTECYIGKGIKVPDHCMVSSRSVLVNRLRHVKPFSVIGGNPAEVKAENYEHLRLSGMEEAFYSERFKQGEKHIVIPVE